MRSLTLTLLLVALVAIPVLDQAQAKEKEWDDWKFGIGLYFPLTGISGDAAMASPTGEAVDVPIDLSFRDITDNYKGSFNGIFALKKSNWSLNLDLGYVKLENEESFTGPYGGEDKITTTMSIMEHEFFIGYQLSDPDEGISEIIFGTRFIDQSLTLKTEVTPAPILKSTTVEEEFDHNWWMGFIGARYMGPLFGAETWNMIIRADMGAFDTSGRLTWRANLGANWKFAEHFNLVLMYKWLGIDYKKGEPGDSDYYYYKATEHGPVIGLGIDF